MSSSWFVAAFSFFFFFLFWFGKMGFNQFLTGRNKVAMTAARSQKELGCAQDDLPNDRVDRNIVTEPSTAPDIINDTHNRVESQGLRYQHKWGGGDDWRWSRAFRTTWGYFCSKSRDRWSDETDAYTKLRENTEAMQPKPKQVSKIKRNVEEKGSAKQPSWMSVERLAFDRTLAHPQIARRRGPPISGVSQFKIKSALDHASQVFPSPSECPVKNLSKLSRLELVKQAQYYIPAGQSYRCTEGEADRLLSAYQLINPRHIMVILYLRNDTTTSPLTVSSPHLALSPCPNDSRTSLLLRLNQGAHPSHRQIAPVLRRLKRRKSRLKKLSFASRCSNAVDLTINPIAPTRKIFEDELSSSIIPRISAGIPSSVKSCSELELDSITSQSFLTEQT
ncbi:putative signal peptide protein [Puccinia sorghi]|uniref:Putative signal peptide protein n=1 Tax=Puccinia sorghi TaxID=27349 RepID=A0A0L6VAH3_9BASI|nr:putative signal peptide protein [Puccinia sorghi]